MSADKDRTPDQIQAEIDQTREDLGETVASVADKADVKKQAKKKAKKKADDVKAQANVVKEAAAAKAGAARETAAARIEEVKEETPDTDEFAGSGGDIGSGPTGDLRSTGEPSGVLPDSPVVLVAAAFVAGIVIGRFTKR